jgi:TDG/mug DNA glycosylase family protein
MSGYQPDILTTRLKAVFCGINPATSAEISGHNFSTPSNRFWNVLHLSGFTDVLQPEDERRLLDYNCGITAVIRRPTRRASEVSLQEFRQARLEFEERMRRLAPRSIAFLGKRAFAAMMDVRDVRWGYQPVAFGGIATWILPNPSGLNRGFMLDALVRAYSEFRIALGS